MDADRQGSKCRSDMPKVRTWGGVIVINPVPAPGICPRLWCSRSSIFNIQRSIAFASTKYVTVQRRVICWSPILIATVDVSGIRFAIGSQCTSVLYELAGTVPGRKAPGLFTSNRSTHPDRGFVYATGIMHYSHDRTTGCPANDTSEA